MPAKFHRNAFVKDAEACALVSTEVQPDGTIVATYADGHTVVSDPDLDGHARLTQRPLYPGGDKTERKIDYLLNQLHHENHD